MDVSYDGSLNMFAIGSRGASTYFLYHCPLCGGKYPDRSKPLWVPLVPSSEFQRIEARLEGLDTVDRILVELGTPDYDAAIVPDGSARCLEYHRLSDLLKVEFVVSGAGRVTHRIEVKAISPRHRRDTDASSTDFRDTGSRGGPMDVVASTPVDRLLPFERQLLDAAAGVLAAGDAGLMRTQIDRINVVTRIRDWKVIQFDCARWFKSAWSADQLFHQRERFHLATVHCTFGTRVATVAVWAQDGHVSSLECPTGLSGLSITGPLTVTGVCAA